MDRGARGGRRQQRQPGRVGLRCCLCCTAHQTWIPHRLRAAAGRERRSQAGAAGEQPPSKPAGGFSRKAILLLTCARPISCGARRERPILAMLRVLRGAALAAGASHIQLSLFVLRACSQYETGAAL